MGISDHDLLSKADGHNQGAWFADLCRVAPGEIAHSSVGKGSSGSGLPAKPCWGGAPWCFNQMRKLLMVGDSMRIKALSGEGAKGAVMEAGGRHS